MTIRLTLLAAAASTALREIRFDDDTPLDDKALNQVRSLAPQLPAATRCLSAPSRRCRETAAALGRPARVEAGLSDIDLGAWRGRTLDEIAAAEPEALASWMRDPASAPHGGESVEQFCRRVGSWLGDLPDDAGRVLAVVEPSVIRAAIMHALTAPATAYWTIDAPPMAVTQLTAHQGRWKLRLLPPSPAEALVVKPLEARDLNA